MGIHRKKKSRPIVNASHPVSPSARNAAHFLEYAPLRKIP